MLRIYGITSIVPIILCMIFHLLLFVEDVKLNRAFKIEIVFVFCQFYPQWKTLKFLYSYLRDGNEEELNRSKDNFDIHVGSLEPFIESALQVSL